MARRLPRMEVIEAFIEAARAPNFRTAAERCALSPAAFSRRIQAFAQFTGQVLFEKGPRGMLLTAAGKECLAELEPIYLEMRRTAFGIGKAEKRTIISLSHSLAVGWLIPRLDRFHAKHPAAEVAIRTDRTSASIRSGEADLGLCAQDIDLSGLSSHRLLDIHVSPVAAPALAAELRRGAMRFEDCRLLKMAQHPDLWPWWSAEAGYAGKPAAAGPTFDVQHAMYEAAAAGLGVAPGADVTIGPHLKSGRLVHLGLPAARYPGCYSLAATSARLRQPHVRQLWSWVLREAREHRLDWSGEPDRAAA